MQSFQQNRHILFHALVALKMLVSLISRLVACSPRIVVDRQTIDRHTEHVLCPNVKRAPFKYQVQLLAMKNQIRF